MNIHQTSCYYPQKCIAVGIYAECKFAKPGKKVGCTFKKIPKNCPLREGPVHISLSSKPFIEQEPKI